MMIESDGTETSGGAWVAGRKVSSQAAILAAAELLGRSRSAVVAGLGTDIAGVRASVALAQAVGGAIDHMDAAAALANLDVMRRSGWIVTTPLQVRTRADTVLLVGDGLPTTWPDMETQLALHAAPTLSDPTPRRLYHLCPGGKGPLFGASAIGSSSDGLLAMLAALRALAKNRRVVLDLLPLSGLAEALAQARFGVAIWSAGTVETLAVEMLCGLIDDLNRSTRFAGLPLAGANGVEGALQAAAWTTGYPVRTGFAGTGPAHHESSPAEPFHDPWRFDAERMISSGEADAAVWISAFSPIAQPWGNAVPTVALVAPGTVFHTRPAVVLEVGRPGRDHDAMLFNQGLGGIAFAAATTPRATPRVADLIAAITASLPSC